jgi:hypothetical protein
MGFVENHYCKQLEGISRTSQFAAIGKEFRGSLSSRYIVQLLDSFVHKGPNGQHDCLVFELLGPTVTAVLAAPRYNMSDDDLDTRLILRLVGSQAF